MSPYRPFICKPLGPLKSRDKEDENEIKQFYIIMKAYLVMFKITGVICPKLLVTNSQH